MGPKFSGFPSETRKFLYHLKCNNSREWFQPRKQIFDDVVKVPMTELVLALGDAMHDFAPELNAEPKKAIYRIYRDTRFSTNKRPYKIQTAAVFSPRGFQKHVVASAYFHVGSDEILAGGGVYAPGPRELRILREYISENAGELRTIVSGRTFCKVFGEIKGKRLRRIPKGFPLHHEASDLLVYKQFLATANYLILNRF